MEEVFDRTQWADYFAQFNQRNHSRKTRLEVFGENGAQQPERGLPFNGISLDNLNGKSNAEIMLGDLIDTRHLTHVISDIRQITPKVGLDGRDEVLELVSREGETTLLHFEPQAMLVS